MTDQKDIQKEFHKNTDIRRFLNRINNPFLSAKEKKISSLILERMPPSGERLLEIGCGEGNNLFFIRNESDNIKYFGLDFSFEKIRFLKQHFKEERAICADALSLPFKEGTFDLILFRDLLHHVPFAREKDRKST
ncbi:MAG: class I SAM-dependent methyltransferase, partial [Candidatus Omnitrophica bacterium]|nr:class I SAM-dependent methyltransferase [Candidatus Omnitrophota bacterium]